VKILFMSQPQVLHPLYDEFCTGAPAHHEIVLYDPKLPAQPQFEGVDVVVEVGGAVSTPELRDLGGERNLCLWQILGTGLDEVDVDGFLRRGIRLANTPGQFSAIALAEHALFLMLLFAKRFEESQVSIEKQLLCVPFTEELAGRTLGLIGFGASARELAKRAASFEMRILAYDVSTVPAETQKELGVECSSDPEALQRIYRESDYLSLHVPLTSATRHMVDAHALGLMKSTAVIVNVARGEVVDEEALAAALEEGRLYGAGLDVFGEEPVPPGHPLRNVPGVIATPHIAGVTNGTAFRRTHAALANIAKIEQGLEPDFVIRSAD
jgi:phosphoglycerate dehydrogenase-like enzyme